MIQCLLVDDDPTIRTLLEAYVRSFGIAMTTLADGNALRHYKELASVEIVVLDLMLPDDDGLKLCQWVRQQHPSLPVVILSAQGDPLSRVLGLELGADDYIAKPFEPRELVARLKAVVRRGSAAPRHATMTHAHFEGWAFDRLRRELLAPDGTVLALSAAESRLLSAFVDYPEQVLTRDRLLTLSRAPNVVVSDRSIDLAVSRLRGKLKDDERSRPLIRTMRGEGYLFDAVVR